MPRLLAALLTLVSFPAFAAEWDLFVGPRSNFKLDIPPGFEVSHDTGGETTIFHRSDGAALLAIWSGDIRDAGFASAMSAKRAQDQDYGWDISYRRETSSWASYSGTLEGRIRYMRAIALCGGRAAYFLIDYDQAEKRDFDPVVTRLVRSLKPAGDCQA